MTDRTCADCGASITHRHGNAKRCKPCGERVARLVQGNDGVRRACSVDDSECRAGRLRHGMCELHYKRFKKTGSTDAQRVDHLTRYRADEDGCWNWTGPIFSNGYGHISAVTFGTTLAHRAFYVAHKGAVPDGLDLDHLCRNRQCVNPDHLEPVTRSVNIQRGVKSRMQGRCKRGHDQTLPGARGVEACTGASFCRECRRIRQREGYHRRRRARTT